MIQQIPTKDFDNSSDSDILKPEVINQIQTKGFEFISSSYQELTNTQYLFLKHSKTGAHIALIQNDDPNLCFNLSFQTHPEDSSGLPHILEHAVLVESRTIPVIDASNELQRSLFLINTKAGTRNDRTVYSTVATDQESLKTKAKFFVDATLGETPSEAVFYRERGHLKSNRNLSTYDFTGTVYNEMRTVYSDPNHWALEAWKKCMFPDSLFSNSSGGNPVSIIDLTYEDFIKAYESYYSVDKAYIGIYGSMPLEDKLDFASDLLRDYQTDETKPPIQKLALIHEPQTFTEKIPCSVDTEKTNAQNRLSINYKFETILDPQEAFELSILIELLGANEKSPFCLAYRETDIDNLYSGCSHGSYLNIECIDFCFDNTTIEDAELAKKATLRILNKLFKAGFDPDLIESCLNRKLSEEETSLNSSGLFLHGKFLLHAEQRTDQAINAAMMGYYSVDELSVSDKVEILRRKLQDGENVFSALIDKYFLNNSARVDITLVADSEIKKNWERAQKEAISRMISNQDANEIQRIERLVTELNVAASDPKKYDIVPVAEIPEKYRSRVRHPEPIVRTYEGSKIVFQPYELEDKARVNFRMDLSDLSPLELILAKLIISTACKIGGEGRKRGDFIIEMSKYNPNFAPFISVIPSLTAENGFRTILNLGTTIEINSIENYFELLKEVFKDPQFNPDFMISILDETIKWHKNRINESNNYLSYLHERFDSATLEYGSCTRALNDEEAMKGLRQFREDLERNPDKFLEEASKLYASLFVRDRFIFTFIASEKEKVGIDQKINSLISAFPSSERNFRAETASEFSPQFNSIAYVTENLTNNFVGMRVQLKDENGKPLIGNASVKVVCKLMSIYLDNEVRNNGGAYGADATYNMESGTIDFKSWRDPKLLETLNAFHSSLELIEDGISENLLRLAKVIAIKSIHQEMTDLEVIHNSIFAYFNGYSDLIDNQARASILNMTMDEFKRITNLISFALKGNEKTIRIYGNRETLEAIQETRYGIILAER
jgi:hypothetical protein